MKAARQGFHLTPGSSPRGRPCAPGRYGRSPQKALVDHISRPGVVGPGELVLDGVLAAEAVEHVRPEPSAGRAGPVLGQVGEGHAVVSQHRVDPVREGLDGVSQEGRWH
jgi:hypothetical protein